MDKGKYDILIIDADARVTRSLRAMLTTKGYVVRLAGSGEEGLSLAVDRSPDLLLLEMALPDMTGLEICRTLREWLTSPMIVLSAKTSQQDKTDALYLGADDYITKPFAHAEILARIHAHLRRAAWSATCPLPARQQIGHLMIDFTRRQVMLGDVAVKLTPLEYAILILLVQHAECVVDQRLLLEEIWGEKECCDTRTLRVHISNIRKKIEPDYSNPRFIITEAGFGYRFSIA